MTNNQWTHYTLAKAYGKGVITGKQLADILTLYKGLKLDTTPKKEGNK